MFSTTVPFSVSGTQERGFVLISTLMLVGLLTILGVTAITMTNLEMETDANLHASTQSFYLAQAGLERGLGKLVADSSWAANVSDPSNAFSGDNSLGAGSYVVEVFNDDPNPGEVRIRSTGSTSGYNAASAALEAVVTKGSFPTVFDYAAFSCSNINLNDGLNEIRDGDVFTSGNFNMDSGTNLVENADVSALGNINVDAGQILGGDVFANGNVNLNSSGSLNVDGNATAGGSVVGPGTVTGTTNSGVSPDPVTDLCTGPQLGDTAIPAETIQDFRDNADTTISGTYVQSGGTITYTGVVHVTGNIDLTGNIELSGNVIFVVDGNADITGPGSIRSNPPGSTVTFLVPSSNLNIYGGGTMVIDGGVQVGTINEDGSNLQGGNVNVYDGSNLAVNGSVVDLNGNINSSGSTLTINYVAPVDENLSGMSNSGITTRQWHEVRY